MRMKVFAGPLLASLLCAQSLPEMRMLPAEMRGGAVDSNQIGSSGLAGVHTKVLFGDPSKAGFYSILLFVPAHTTIAKRPVLFADFYQTNEHVLAAQAETVVQSVCDCFIKGTFLIHGSPSIERDLDKYAIF